MSKYVVVRTNNVNYETFGTEFTDYRKATAYLHWCWERWFNKEVAEFDDVDEGNCYHESTYAKIQLDSGAYTEFYLVEISEKIDDFPVDWERYVCE